MPDEKIYYEDQTNWGPEDFYALFRYLNRLFQYIGPSERLTAAMAAADSLSERDRARAERAAKHQAKRTGFRDDELAAIDVLRLSPETRYLSKHMLIDMKRLTSAITRFPNLRELEKVGELGHPIFLSANPRREDSYLTSVGILI